MTTPSNYYLLSHCKTKVIKEMLTPSECLTEGIENHNKHSNIQETRFLKL